jgi:hypothetical protein
MRLVYIQRSVLSGALAIAFVGVTQLLQVKDLDTPLTVSLYAFVVAMPLIAAALVLVDVVPRRMGNAYILEVWAGFAGVQFSFVGMAGIFWHFSWFAGALFIVISVPTYFFPSTQCSPTVKRNSVRAFEGSRFSRFGVEKAYLVEANKKRISRNMVEVLVGEDV